MVILYLLEQKQALQMHMDIDKSSLMEQCTRHID